MSNFWAGAAILTWTWARTSVGPTTGWQAIVARADSVTDQASAAGSSPREPRPVTTGGGGRAGGASATQHPPLPPVRTVDEILNDATAAMGGAAALDRHRSLHTKMEITFKGLGITGTAEHYGAVGDKALTVTEIPHVASTREGSDGTHFWSEDPINGLRLLEGAEAEQARVEAAWNAELRTKDLFQDIKASNERGDDGAILECLTLLPRIGPATTNCFEAKTHLMTIQRGVRSGPQGDMPFTARLSDWRLVDDVKMAYATDMQVGPLAFSGRMLSVEMDVPLNPALFEVPRVGKGKAERARRPSGSGRGKGKDRERDNKDKAGAGNQSGEPNPGAPTSPVGAVKR